MRLLHYFRSPASCRRGSAVAVLANRSFALLSLPPMRCTGVFGYPLHFRPVLWHFRLPSTTARGVRCPPHSHTTTAAGRIVVSSPSLISVSHFFAQPAKMVWITVDDKVLPLHKRAISFPCFLANICPEWSRIGADYDPGEIESRRCRREKMSRSWRLLAIVWKRDDWDASCFRRISLAEITMALTLFFLISF